MEKKKKIMLAVMLVAIISISVVGTYAYFVSETNNDRRQSAVLKTGTMALTFEDNDRGISEKLMFGESVIKRFKITNTGSLDASLSLDWNNFINTYMNGSLSYNLSYASDENTDDADYEEIIPETNMPTSNEPINQTIASELSVPTGETYYYNLKITLNNLPDTPQDDDLDAVFSTNFGVDEPVRYRYYTLSVDPNGGTWGEYVSTQEYLLKNKETMTITNTPTRTGYTFSGWKLTGISSKFESNVFTMGIGNSKLVAQWTPNKHTVTVTINGETRELEGEYGGKVDLGEPPVQDGYTFTGWEVTGGTAEGNSLTITEDTDVTVKPTYVANKYKYIVYHKQQNITNDEYTLVSADTDEGEADYNSKVTPEVRDYTGFTKPSEQSLTIKVETTYPPVLNKVEYNYDREKHTLTVNSNGGSYSGSTSQILKYEQSITLDAPSKTGYNFTNWSTSSGTVDGTTFKMGTSDATVTANYTAKQVTINFNANGGTTTTASKTVTYDSTYRDLPTPAYSGYKFLGWFTAASGGTQVTSSTEVKTEGPVTLFAQWRLEMKLSSLLEKANDANITTYTAGNTKEMYTFNHPATSQTEALSDYRYIGSNPNNYIIFNNEIWRIIGVFKLDDNEQHIKIMRNNFIDNKQWDSNSTIDWNKSSLQSYLNGDYYNSLTSSAQNQIYNSIWYLGGSSDSGKSASVFYTSERSNIKGTGTTSSSSIIQIKKNIGLIYPSDYLYTFSNDVDNKCFSSGYSCNSDLGGAPTSSWMYNESINKNNTWTISPFSNSSYASGILYINSTGGFWTAGYGGTSSNSSYNVIPTVYLTSNLSFTGDGSSVNPYTIE